MELFELELVKTTAKVFINLEAVVAISRQNDNFFVVLFNNDTYSITALCYGNLLRALRQL